jgi:hypothetical protein
MEKYILFLLPVIFKSSPSSALENVSDFRLATQTIGTVLGDQYVD